jgi:hypothetical protein
MLPRLARRVAERLDEDDIASRIRTALAGHDLGTHDVPPTVIWDDAGDEVLVHLDSLRLRIASRTVIASVDFESDETGRAPLIVRFVFGGNEDAAGLIAATDEFAHGDPVLAARWGNILRDVLWATLVGTADQYARERGMAPQAIQVQDGHLRFRTTVDIPLVERIDKDLPPPPRRKAAPRTKRRTR